MLKNINPLLNGELLGVLQEMGHGDDILVVDVNYPAYSTAAYTAYGNVIHMAGANSAEVVKAILSVMPLDAYVDSPACRMEVIDAPTEVPQVQAEVQIEINVAEGREWPMKAVERLEFYDQAKSCYAVVLTGDRRLYGCFMFKKGVILPEEA